MFSRDRRVASGERSPFTQNDSRSCGDDDSNVVASFDDDVDLQCSNNNNSNSRCTTTDIITAKRFVHGPDGVVYGKICSTAEPVNSTATCWYCRRGEPMGELYKPCSCDSFIHRSCLRQWRAGWINPRNYFSCPNCMYSYNLEQVRPPTTESKERMKSNYRVSVIKVWVMVLLAFAGMVAALAGISYGCDTADKNIPVAVRCLLTSVVGGFPNSNSTAAWREDFKRPDVAVWPYYTVFGLFLTSVLVLISFVCFGSMFEESDRRRTGHCNCVDDCCSGASNGPIYIWTDPTYYGHHHHFHTHNNSSCCDDCGNSCGSHHGGCNGCECSGSGGSNDIRGVIATIILIIVVTIIVSAIVTLALFAMKKCSLLYDRLTVMLASQQSELEGETVVLGIGESWRPNDAV